MPRGASLDMSRASAVGLRQILPMQTTRMFLNIRASTGCRVIFTAARVCCEGGKRIPFQHPDTGSPEFRNCWGA
ncbi:hypothetical protein D3C85_1800960 [compost metagenome]